MGQPLLEDHVRNLQWRWKSAEDNVFEECSDGVCDAEADSTGPLCCPINEADHARTDLLRIQAGLDGRYGYHQGTGLVHDT